MKKQYVIFDFDGTITDSFGPSSKVLLAAAKAAGLPSGDDILAVISEKYGVPTSALLESCWPKQDREIFYQALKDFNEKEHTPLFKEAESTLKAIANAGIGMSIFTGRLAIGIFPSLKFFNIDKLFASVICRDDVKIGKPDPEGLNKIIEPLIASGMKKDEILFVGDSRADMDCAKNAGIDFVAVTEAENVSADRFISLGLPKENIIPLLRDLPTWLKI